MPRVPLFLVLQCPLLVCNILAQDTARTDTTPFRPRQWAAQFGGGFSFATLGVLRFSSPTSAWLLDARLSGGHDHRDDSFRTPTGDTTSSSFNSGAVVSVRLGRRSYRAGGRRVASFLGLGLHGGFSHSSSRRDDQGGETNGWSAGAFAELGGAYFVAEKLSVGAAADLSFSYGRATLKSTGGPPFKSVRWGYDVSAPNLRFVVTLYF